MDRRNYERILDGMRLVDGSVWPIPIALDVPESLAERLEAGGRLALQDDEGFTLAVLDAQEIWQPDKRREAEAVYGTSSKEHPGVRALFEDVHDHYVGGRIGIQLPMHPDYEELRNTPAELRRSFGKLGWWRIVGFHSFAWIRRIRARCSGSGDLFVSVAGGVLGPGSIFGQ